MKNGRCKKRNTFNHFNLLVKNKNVFFLRSWKSQVENIVISQNKLSRIETVTYVARFYSRQLMSASFSSFKVHIARTFSKFKVYIFPSLATKLLQLIVSIMHLYSYNLLTAFTGFFSFFYNYIHLCVLPKYYENLKSLKSLKYVSDEKILKTEVL